jgi:hypothetical protein
MPADFLPDVAGFLLDALALAIIPFIPLALGSRAINSLQDARLPWTPVIEILALAVGVLAGAFILARSIEPTSLEGREIFRPGGPWDLSFGQFLAHWGNPLTYRLGPLLPWPFSDGRGGAGLLISLLAAATVYAPIVHFRTLRAVANGLRNLLIVLWAAYATTYYVCFMLWLLNKMNFWAFLLLLFAIHLLRSRSERVVLRLR